MINKIQPYEKLVNYVKANPQKGLTLPHIDIEQIIGIPYRIANCMHYNNKYSYQIQKANKELTRLCLRLEPIKGFGYRIINDNQYVDSMRKAYNTGVKNIEKAMFIGNNTDTSSLTTQEKLEFIAVYNKVIAAHSSVSIIPLPVKQKKIIKNVP